MKAGAAMGIRQMERKGLTGREVKGKKIVMRARGESDVKGRLRLC